MDYESREQDHEQHFNKMRADFENEDKHSSSKDTSTSAPPSRNITTITSATRDSAIGNTQAESSPELILSKGMTYICCNCDKPTAIRRGDPIRCRECSHR